MRLFNVPLDPSGYAPYTRVNHAKFMVSEQVPPPLPPTLTPLPPLSPPPPPAVTALLDAFISTSNWSGDYLIRSRTAP